MNYIMIRTDDMLNGSGLRVVYFCTACDHKCDGCHNPETWDKNNGEQFTEDVKKKIFDELENDYISGITFSGGDPLNSCNLYEIRLLIDEIKEKYPSKTIWLYTGYEWESIINSREMTKTILNVDVLVDGKFEKDKADVNYKWAGSTNQRVINVKESLSKGEIVLWQT